MKRLLFTLALSTVAVLLREQTKKCCSRSIRRTRKRSAGSIDYFLTVVGYRRNTWRRPLARHVDHFFFFRAE